MARKKKAETSDKATEEEGEDKNQYEGMSDKEIREVKLAELFTASNKKFGKSSLVYARDFGFKQVPRVSTGIFPLDYALGGGLPMGRISLIYGPPQSMKTTNLLRAVGNAQRSCSICWTFIKNRPVEGKDPVDSCVCGQNRDAVIAWLDVEGVWHDGWASNFLDCDRLLLTQPETAEHTVDQADAMVRSGTVDVVVIDSIAFMTPAAELERSSAESGMAEQARIVGGGMRRFVSGINTVSQQEGRRPTFWFTNQIRMKVGLVFGNPETKPGGMAQGFATSVEVRQAPEKYTMDDATGKPVSAKFKYSVSKNKTGPAKMEGEYQIALMKTEVKKVGQVVDEEWVIDMGIKTGLIDKAPKGNTITLNGKDFQGKSTLARHWMLNRGEYDTFKDDLLPILLAV